MRKSSLLGKNGTLLFLFAALGSSVSVRAVAQVRIDVTAPRLSPGFARLEASLAEYLAGYGAEASALVAESVSKPALMTGFAEAASALALGLAVPSRAGSGSSASVGFLASLESDLADYDALMARVENVGSADDSPMGAAAAPLVVAVALDLSPLLRGLSLELSGGVTEAESNGVGVRAVAAGAIVDFGFFPRFPASRVVAWTGAALRLGASFAETRASTNVSVGSIEREFELDADGRGPLPPLDASATIDPELELSFAARSLDASFALRSGVRFFDSVSFSAGGGVSVAFAASELGAEGGSAIVAQSAALPSGVVEEDARFIVSGSLVREEPPTLRPFAFACLSLEAAAFRFSLPVVARPGTDGWGLCVGFSVGAAFR